MRIIFQLKTWNTVEKSFLTADELFTTTMSSEESGCHVNMMNCTNGYPMEPK